MMRPDQKLIESLKNSNFCIDEINEVGQRLSVDDAVNLLNRYGNESGTGGHWSDIVKITHDDYIESEGELKKSDVGKYRDVDGNILTNSEIFKWLKEVEKENAENFVQELVAAGYNASIIGKRKGLFAVSYSSFASRKEAVEGLALAKNHNSKAWILNQ